MGDPISVREQIVDEALRFLHTNKGKTAKQTFVSNPRISSEIPDCSMPMTFDHYNYCSLGCSYCFAYVFKTNNPAMRNNLDLKSVNPEKLLNDMAGNCRDSRANAYYKHFYSKKFLLHWGGLADPFCNFEKDNGIGATLIDGLGDLNYPTLFSFKGGTILQKRYMNLFEKYSKQKNFAFQVSVITGQEDLAKDVEIGVPTPKKRIMAIKRLSDMGYFTILRLRPFIIGVSDIGLDELLHRALEAGINGVSMEFYAHDVRGNCDTKLRQKWIEELTGINDINAYFRDLSPSERGGYRRLNRLVKEKYVKEVYKFCADNDLVFGCSDPDFKELCTSGSCCAMPDHYPENNLLENWTRDQLTYHVKELRKRYHKTGEVGSLYFDEVYKDKTYLTENKFMDDHISIMKMTNAERRATNIKEVLRKTWNNLNSPACPSSYLHGKVLAVDAEKGGDLIYKYNPSPYEKRWTREGIDLTL